MAWQVNRRDVKCRPLVIIHYLLFPIVKPTSCTNVSNTFYFGMTLYMFRTVFPSVISSSVLYIQQQARVYIKQVQRLQETERCRVLLQNEIKQIWYIGASLWFYYSNISLCTASWTSHLTAYIQGVTGGKDQTSGGCSLC